VTPDEARVLNRLRDAAQQWAGALALAKEDGHEDEINEAAGAFAHYVDLYEIACKRAGQPDLCGSMLDHPQPPRRGTVWRP
jgi:hypothetical protein